MQNAFLFVGCPHLACLITDVFSHIGCCSSALTYSDMADFSVSPLWFLTGAPSYRFPMLAVLVSPIHSFPRLQGTLHITPPLLKKGQNI